MNKILIKLVYFLMKYIKTDIASFEKFHVDLEKFAPNEYIATTVDRTTYQGGETVYKFSAYIAGYDWHSADTPKLALEALINSKQQVQKREEIKTIID